MGGQSGGDGGGKKESDRQDALTKMVKKRSKAKVCSRPSLWASPSHTGLTLGLTYTHRAIAPLPSFLSLWASPSPAHPSLWASPSPKHLTPNMI